MTDAIHQAHATQLGQMLRLAVAIADEAAHTDISSFCCSQRMGNHTYYDTSALDPAASPQDRQAVESAVEYLHLRGRVARHPAHGSLLRFNR